VAASHARAAAVSTPSISGSISGPGMMYPNPAISIVRGAMTVESFPYVSEEYFVSGMTNDAPFTTRVIVRRPKDPSQFSGVVVSEALHAGGRPLIAEGWFLPEYADMVRGDVKATAIPPR
jgi:hypothetical protein